MSPLPSLQLRLTISHVQVGRNCSHLIMWDVTHLCQNKSIPDYGTTGCNPVLGFCGRFVRSPNLPQIWSLNALPKAFCPQPSLKMVTDVRKSKTAVIGRPNSVFTMQLRI